MRSAESLTPLLYAGAVMLGLAAGLAVVFLSLRLNQPPHRIFKLFAGGTMAAVIGSFPGLVPYILLLAMPFVAWLPKSPIPFVNTMNLLVGIGILGVLFTRATSKEQSPKMPRVWTVIAFFTAILFLAFLRGWIAPPAGFSYAALARVKALWIVLAGLLAFLPFYHFIDNRKALKRALVIAAIAMALGALGCLSETHGARVGYRAKGGLGDINDEAAFYAYGMCFFLPVLSRARALGAGTRLVLFGAMGVSLLGLFLPNSRGALVAMALAGFLYVSLFRRKMLFFYVAMLVLAWFAAPAAVRDRLTGTYTDVAQAGVTYDAMNYHSGGRLDIWKATLDSMNPLTAVIGVGYGNLPIMLHEQIDAYRNSHNVYLQLWGEAGLAGIAIFITLMMVMLRMGWRLRKRKDPLAVGVGEGMICAILCLAIANLFGDRFMSFSLEALIVFIAAAGARMLAETEPAAGVATPAGRSGTAATERASSGPVSKQKLDSVANVLHSSEGVNS